MALRGAIRADVLHRVASLHQELRRNLPRIIAPELLGAHEGSTLSLGLPDELDQGMLALVRLDVRQGAVRRLPPQGHALEEDAPGSALRPQRRHGEPPVPRVELTAVVRLPHIVEHTDGMALQHLPEILLQHVAVARREDGHLLHLLEREVLPGEGRVHEVAVAVPPLGILPGQHGVVLLELCCQQHWVCLPLSLQLLKLEGQGGDLLVGYAVRGTRGETRGQRRSALLLELQPPRQCLIGTLSRAARP
mmetsp:Transcript_30596/g.90823  ORF Transcript_30596/g.90823 Transcript_30596/m.90823 type:complete len:249 (-) Transcript_30596:1613-2359(-)